MNIKLKMRYLGFDSKTSKKGTSYLMVKFMMGSDIMEFYVPSDRMAVTTAVGGLQQFSEVDCVLKIKSFNNKPELELDSVQAVK